jgi:hypothetical protein
MEHNGTERKYLETLLRTVLVGIPNGCPFLIMRPTCHRVGARKDFDVAPLGR